MTPNHSPKYILNPYWTDCDNLLYHGAIMNIPTIANIISRMGWEYEIILPLVTRVYTNKGDTGVMILFYEMTGIRIDNIRRGKYIMNYQRFI